MKLHYLTKKECNGLSGVLVEEVSGNMAETMCSMLFLKGDDHPCFPKCTEALDHKHEVLEGNCFGISNSRFRDAYLSELESRVQTRSPACAKLKAWRDASDDPITKKVAKEIGKKALTEVLRSRLQAKRLGR